MKNLIGISGKIGSGKDTVGLILQYLTDHLAAKDNISFQEWLDEKAEIPAGYNYTVSDWEIKKYADKLKDIGCMIMGCSRGQLENHDFKNAVLPSMWDKYAVEKDGKIEFIGTEADANKMFDHYVINLKLDSGKIQVKKVHLTPRLVLQQLGTECGRDIIHQNIWVNSLFADYKPLNPEKAASMGNVLDYSDCDYPNWVITDMRFPNELDGIKDRGGITIRVNRDTGVEFTTEDGVKEHPSETALDNAEFDYVIDNSGTLDQLVDKVREILDAEKISYHVKV